MQARDHRALVFVWMWRTMMKGGIASALHRRAIARNSSYFAALFFPPTLHKQCHRCHDVGFVHVDGPFEGDMAVTAGKRVGRK
jgi:hypothetical protein